MPYKNPEERKAYRKAYYWANREENIKKTAQWRESHKEQRNATERKRNAIRFREDPSFREYRRIKSRESYLKHHGKRLQLAIKHRGTPREYARKQAYNAIRRGDIIRPDSCQSCGLITNHLQMHHNDYSKPLEVTFLCALCHASLRSLV